MRRTRALRLGAVTASLLIIGSGCALEDALPAPNCVTGESGVIVAQSVPGAELIPCLDSLPVGWAESGVTIGESGSEFRFSSDRAGADAAVLRYTKQCDLRDAVQVPSGDPAASRFDDIHQVQPNFRSTVTYVFDGGCVAWDFDFDADAPAALAIELDDRLTLFSRQALNEDLAENFIAEEV